MAAKIYCGNLSWGTNNDSLRDAFSQFGQVLDCIVMTEPGTGRSRGFGFVTYGQQAEADAAIGAMNDQELTAEGSESTSLTSALVVVEVVDTEVEEEDTVEEEEDTADSPATEETLATADSRVVEEATASSRAVAEATVSSRAAVEDTPPADPTAASSSRAATVSSRVVVDRAATEADTKRSSELPLPLANVLCLSF